MNATRNSALGGVLATVLLSGCGTDPQDELQALVGDVVVEANDRDAAGVRSTVEELLGRIDAAVAAGDLTAGEAEALREHALAVQAGADEIDPNVLARREAERAAQEAQAQLEAERAAAAEAERRQAEADAEKAVEEASGADEDERETDKKDDEKDDEKDGEKDDDE